MFDTSASFGDLAGKFESTLVDRIGSAFSTIDISDIISVDLMNISIEQAKMLKTGVSAIKQIHTATESIIRPLGQVEEQAATSKKQLEEWAKAIDGTGVAAQFAKDTIEEYRKTYVTSIIEDLENQISPQNALSVAMQNAGLSILQTVSALKSMGATAAEVALIESRRTEILQKAFETATREVNQDYAQRYASVTGGDKDAVSGIISRENELRKLEEQFGRTISYAGTLADKVAVLNAQKYEGRTDWTVADVQNVIASLGMSVETWFNMFGRQEGLVGPEMSTTSYALALEQKATALNTQKYEGRTDWTSDAVKKAMEEMGLTVAQWFESYGRSEGFAEPVDYYSQFESLQKAEEAKRKLDTLQVQQKKYLEQLVNGWDGVIDALSNARDALHRQNVDESRGFEAARAEFDLLYTQALGGDTDAANKMGQIASELLSVGKQQSVSQSAYQDLFNDIDAKLFDTALYAGKQYDSNKEQIDILNKQLGIQEESKDLNADILAAQKDLEAAIKALEFPESAYNPNTGSGGGTTSSREDKILAEKVASLNAQRYQGKSTWTIEDVRQAIAVGGMTFDQWYERYGKTEGFATGGVTVPGIAFEANELGRHEIFMTPIAQGVLSADDSKRTMDSVIAMGRLMSTPRALPAPYQPPMTSGSSMLRAENTALREEVHALRSDFSRMASLLERIVLNTKDTSEGLGDIKANGLQTRDYMPPVINIIPFPA